MADARCAHCGREEFLPFRCKLCAQPHCLEHRLPENHRCAGLGDYRTRARMDRYFSGEQERERSVPVRVRGPSPAGEAGAKVWAFFTRSTTHKLLGIILLVYMVQWVGGFAYALAAGLPLGVGPMLVTCQLAFGACPGGGPLTLDVVMQKPWSLLTSIFTHALHPFHLFFNGLILYFFGSALEQRIGSKRLLALFLGAGLSSALVQAVIFPGAVIGASGGLMGVLMVLTLLAPTMQVIFWFFPLPLWVMTALFVVLDVMGFFNPGAGIAHLAHLVGLGIGAAYGLHLKQRGVLPKVTNTWAFSRRL